jgi:hypothetical protein
MEKFMLKNWAKSVKGETPNTELNLETKKSKSV